MATMLERNKKVKTPKKTYAEHMEDALYREVWEDVNNEKTMQFIKKYSKQIMAGALIVLIIATGFQIGIRTHRQNKMSAAVIYETSVANADADALAALADNTSGGTADLALFQSYFLDKDHDISKLEELVASGNTRDFRDLARIHIVTIRGDEMSGAAVEKYLSDLDTKKSPYYYVSRLMVAQKYLSEGNRKAANKILDAIISDADAPATITATATSLR